MLKIIPEYHRTEYLPKVENAGRIAPYMQVDGNNSKSFNQMINAIKQLMESGDRFSAF